MGFKGRNGTAMKAELSPTRAARASKRRRREEAEWKQKAGKVEQSFACICDRDPSKCRAMEHVVD